MNKELIELKTVAHDFFAKAEAFIKSQKAKEPSDQHLLDDGWIRHTGDVCPVHELDEVRYIAHERESFATYRAKDVNWLCVCGITHYKVVKAHDPHAENKALYEHDARMFKEPWKLWECLNPRNSDKEFKPLYGHPSWHEHVQYRRKQTKQLVKPQRVSWSCPLLKGANTNRGELLAISSSRIGWLCSGALSAYTLIGELCLNQLQPSNWQAYNGEDLNLLHEAGFVVELRYATENYEGRVELRTMQLKNYKGMRHDCICNYRVIAIRDGFTANPAEVV